MIESADFMEMLLKHLVRSRKVLNEAKRLKLGSDDFLLSEEFGIQLYKVIADIALESNQAPLSSELFGAQLKRYIEDGTISMTLVDQVAELFHWIYSTELDEEYFTNNLKEFIRTQRQKKAVSLIQTDLPLGLTELNKIQYDFGTNTAVSEENIISPFAALVKKSRYHMVPTGIRTLDTALGGGLGLAEYGLIVGFSGGGKTAFSSFMAGNCAINGFNTAYLSFEEEKADMSNRFYSRFFEIDYTELHNGSAVGQLEERFANTFFEADHEKLKNHLRLFNLKEHAPMSTDEILRILEENYEKTGWAPDVVFLDQFQFIESSGGGSKDESQWTEEQQVSAEIDLLSHRKVGGKSFALWVNHQAKGKLKKTFTRDDIHGFKGIIQKADTVMGIGRESEQSVDFCVFSLKSRHSKAFAVDMTGELQHMKFNPSTATQAAPPMQTGYAFGTPRPDSAQVDSESINLVAQARNGVVAQQAYQPQAHNNGRTSEENQASPKT